MFYKNLDLHCLIFSNMVFVMKKVIIMQAVGHKKMNYIINTLIITPCPQNTGRKLDNHCTNYEEHIPNSK